MRLGFLTGNVGAFIFRIGFLVFRGFGGLFGEEGRVIWGTLNPYIPKP